MVTFQLIEDNPRWNWSLEIKHRYALNGSNSRTYFDKAVNIYFKRVKFIDSFKILHTNFFMNTKFVSMHFLIFTWKWKGSLFPVICERSLWSLYPLCFVEQFQIILYAYMFSICILENICFLKFCRTVRTWAIWNILFHDKYRRYYLILGYSQKSEIIVCSWNDGNYDKLTTNHTNDLYYLWLR